MGNLAPLAAVAALALLAAAAAAEPVRETKTVPPGEFMERDIPLAQGARVAWSIEVAPRTEAAAYNIHSHQGNEATNHEQGVANATAAGAFVAPKADTYSWMVINALSRSPVQVTLVTEVLAGAAGNPQAKALPGTEGFLAIAALGSLALLARRR